MRSALPARIRPTKIWPFLLLLGAGCGLDDFDWDNCRVPWEMKLDYEGELPGEVKPLERGVPARNVRQQGSSVTWQVQLEEVKLSFAIEEGRFSLQHLFVGERDGEGQRGFFEGECTHSTAASEMYDERLDRYVCSGQAYTQENPDRRHAKLTLEQVDRCGS